MLKIGITFDALRHQGTELSNVLLLYIAGKHDINLFIVVRLDNEGPLESNKVT